MTNKESALIELTLYKEILAFSEKNTISNDLIRNFIINFCLDNKINIDETVTKLNQMLPQQNQIKKTDILPNTDLAKQQIAYTAIYDYIDKKHALFNLSKQEEIISDFSLLSGFDQDIIQKGFNNRLNYEKQKFIEKRIYPLLKKHNYPADSDEYNLYVTEISKSLNTTPDFVLKALEEADKNKEEH